MAGGSPAPLAALAAVFETFSSAVYHMGEPGSGHTTKVLNNFLNAIALAATAEAMVAGRKAGLDLAQLLEVLNHSSGVNFATLNRFPHVIEGDYLEGGLTNELMAKDMRLYLALLQQLGVTSFTGTACLGAFDLSLIHISHRLRAGTVWINNYRVWNWLMPFGGYKQSGYGRENGIEVMEHYTQTKSVWVDLQEDAPDWFGD